ncbi:MAG: hypothetical protein ACOCX3_04035 [Chloroflexota bacterium]
MLSWLITFIRGHLAHVLGMAPFVNAADADVISREPQNQASQPEDGMRRKPPGGNDEADDDWDGIDPDTVW